MSHYQRREDLNAVPDLIGRPREPTEGSGHSSALKGAVERHRSIARHRDQPRELPARQRHGFAHRPVEALKRLVEVGDPNDPTDELRR